MTNLTAYEITNMTKTNGYVNMIYTLFYNYNVQDQTFTNSEEFNYVISEQKLVLIDTANQVTGITEYVTLKQGNQTVFRASTDMYDVTNSYNNNLSILFLNIRMLMYS